MSEVEITAALISILVIESMLLWAIYKIRNQVQILRRAKNDGTIPDANWMVSWYLRKITNRKRGSLLFSTIYSSAILVFWVVLFIFLRDEVLEIISLTWFLLPMVYIIGFLDGYSDRYTSTGSEGITKEKLRPAILHLQEQAYLGDTKAIDQLKKFKERDDEVGDMTKEILREPN